MNEEFEKWWLCTDEDMFQNHTKPEFKAAYLAGAAAMRERCAGVADNEANGFRNTRIAAAIREIGVE